MSGKNPFVLCCAKRFLGHLVGEFPRDFHVSFITAGGKRAKILEPMNRVSGIETADCEFVETAGSMDIPVKFITGVEVAF